MRRMRAGSNEEGPHASDRHVQPIDALGGTRSQERARQAVGFKARAPPAVRRVGCDTV